MLSTNLLNITKKIHYQNETKETRSNEQIEVSELAGYEFFIDGEKVQWEEMNRSQQIRVLNSFSQGYNLFINFLKSE